MEFVIFHVQIQSQTENLLIFLDSHQSFFLSFFLSFSFFLLEFIFHPKRYAGPEVFSRMLVKKTEGDIEGLQKSDVYSFAITLWETLSRKIPWEHLDSESIQQAVTSGNRPSLDTIKLKGGSQENVKALLIGILKRCWSENIQERPRFDEIIKALNIV